ncbi:MAG: CRISPR-associated protein Cas5 [Peptostreptococcus sp.]|uniref:CRISPR-associated protein Cas5 n=1 Tax=Peptostreptococcus sp. TaxID=1262 RepID=UPI002FC5D4FF
MNKKILRIKLHQNKAHYRKEETINNKMTYPLPPYSTVIGAIHAACGYEEYRPMDISIQGRYESMDQEVYQDLVFLNSIMDDRGVLVKLDSADKLNDGYKIVAKVLKSQGNSFKKKITIDISDEEELDEYIRISNLRDVFQEENALLKEEEKEIKSKIKSLKIKQKEEEKSSDIYKVLDKEIKELNDLIKSKKKELKERKDRQYTEPISLYASLNTSIKRYEVLYGVDLVIHVRSDENTIEEIMDNVLNITSIGRSEDFVDNVEAKLVEISKEDYESKFVNSPELYSAYIDYNSIEEKMIKYTSRRKSVSSIPTRGTCYYLNKDYVIEKNKRIFNKKKVVYLSGYKMKVDENIQVDDEGYIMSFL